MMRPLPLASPERVPPSLTKKHSSPGRSAAEGNEQGEKKAANPTAAARRSVPAASERSVPATATNPT